MFKPQFTNSNMFGDWILIIGIYLYLVSWDLVIKLT